MKEASPIVYVVDHSVDPRSVTAARIVGMGTILGVAAAPFVGITIAWGLAGIPTWLYLSLLAGWAFIVCIAATAGYKLPALHHRHLSYRVDETGMRIRRGIFWRKTTSIPRSRVQHTDVTQGPVQRTFGLATLTVHTAGTEGASIPLAGLEHRIALQLRDHLLPTHRNDDG